VDHTTSGEFVLHAERMPADVTVKEREPRKRKALTGWVAHERRLLTKSFPRAEDSGNS
jgi:hypothetical protein